MQMPHRLTTVLTFVGDETEAVFKAESIDERGKFFDAFGKSLGLSVGHLYDVGVMLFGNEQKMHGRLRIEVFDDYHIVVLIDFG